ncbi:hypothetical protein FIBSPDRAFT_939480 [Athelia psychrophila]|uniref:Uncharacterized protein n=1 Tax=Athelia psychrophila TaxID=1759441 RepID=A0A167XRB4_9AGAM|nr:hypothetical protein FIBSPDRAFT_939480 [Fibularhizoctonia sp. CBS 109695]
MGLPQNLQGMANCKPTFVTTDTSGGSVTNINGDYIKGQRLEVNGDYIACANINVNPPDSKEQNGRFLPNPPPNLIRFLVFKMFVRMTNARAECRSDIEPSPFEFKLISLCGLVIKLHPRSAFVIHVRVANALAKCRSNINPFPSKYQQIDWTVFLSIPRCSCAAHDQHRSHVISATYTTAKWLGWRIDARTFGWIPGWLIQEVNHSLGNLQEFDCALAQFYLLLENNLSVHGGARHSGKDAKELCSVGPELARVLMCRARSEGGKGGARNEKKGPDK